MKVGDLELGLALCHTDCAIPGAFGGPLQDFLGKVKSFMDANPREVVTLLLTNPDNVAMNSFGDVFKAAGLDKMSFVPDGSPAALPMDRWPTLGEMIDKNQRLVTYIGEFVA